MHGVGHRSRCLSSAIDAALVPPATRAPPKGGLGGGFRLHNGTRLSPVKDDFLPAGFGPGIHREAPHASPRREPRRPRRQRDIDTEPLGIDEPRRRRQAVAGPSMTVEEVVAGRIRLHPNQPPPPPAFLQQHMKYREFQQQFQQKQHAHVAYMQQQPSPPPPAAPPSPQQHQESPLLHERVEQEQDQEQEQLRCGQQQAPAALPPADPGPTPRLPPLGGRAGIAGFLSEIDDIYAQLAGGGALHGALQPSGATQEAMQRLGRDPVTGLTPRWLAAGYPAGY